MMIEPDHNFRQVVAKLKDLVESRDKVIQGMDSLDEGHLKERLKTFKPYYFFDDNKEKNMQDLTNYPDFLTPEALKQEYGDYIQTVLQENPTAKLVGVEAVQFLNEFSHSPILETVRQDMTPKDAFSLSGEQDVHEFFDATVFSDSVLEGDQLLTTEEAIDHSHNNAIKFGQFNDRVLLHVMEETNKEVVSLIGMSKGGTLYAVVK